MPVVATGGTDVRRGACLSAEQLAAYGAGRLAPDLVEQFAVHLDSCPTCISTLEALATEDDSLVQCLRDLVAGTATAADTPATARGDTAPLPVVAPLDDAPRRPMYGAYQVAERLGRGGMGVVYRARQVYLNRPVALKLLRHGDLASPDTRARFFTEAEAVARLDHPHIVRVYEFGEEGGEPFFAMELLSGGSLAQRLAAGPLSPTDAARLVAALAGAVAYAHGQKVLHRDLKPANILLQGKPEIRGPKSERSDSDFGLRISDFSPKVSDFGLAKLLDAPDEQTHSDAIIGTASYMAPEQARGDARAIGPATDVYGLGAILYECLTGRPPFKTDSRDATLHQVQTTDPEPPSDRRPGVPRDLEAVCLKCLEKQPADRYASAAELADDLNRFLRGEPTRARPLNWLTRVGRAIRRRPGRVAAVVVVALMGASAPLWPRFGAPDDTATVQEIEAELAAGNQVELIPETGPPRWSRWRLGGAKAQKSLAPDGVFSVHSWDCTLLELVRDAQSARYRVRAEVRHEWGEENGEIGVYAAHRETTAGDFQVHTYVHLSFNDVKDLERNHPPARMPPQAVPRPPLGGNPVTLTARLSRAQGGAVVGDHKLAKPAALRFPPTGAGPGPWRAMVVEIGPDRAKGTWTDGRETGPLEFAAAEKQADWVWSHWKLPPAARAETRMTARGGVGLFVVKASASFRRVSVEPIAGGP